MKKYLYLAILVLFVATSCKTVKLEDTLYFRNLPDSVKELTQPKAVYHSPVIQVDDNLSIFIQTLDPSATAVLNQGNTESNSTATNNGGVTSTAPVPTIASATSSFLVDNSGNVELSLIGKVKLAGLTIEQARDTIRLLAQKYYKQPTVAIRFTNFRVVLLGELARPSIYTVPTEKISILDAIGYAGDLTIYGRRDNILLIRHDSLGNEKFIRLNLNSSTLFQSPYFYLHQNDVVYVQPNKAKIVASDATVTRFLAFATLGATIIFGLLTRIK